MPLVLQRQLADLSSLPLSHDPVLWRNPTATSPVHLTLIPVVPALHSSLPARPQ